MRAPFSHFNELKAVSASAHPFSQATGADVSSMIIAEQAVGLVVNRAAGVCLVLDGDVGDRELLRGLRVSGCQHGLLATPAWLV